jgi:hypothetical protein
VTLHLAIHEQAVGRAVDISVLDVDPRAIDEPMQMFDGGRFFGGRHRDSAERD